MLLLLDRWQGSSVLFLFKNCQRKNKEPIGILQQQYESFPSTLGAARKRWCTLNVLCSQRGMLQDSPTPAWYVRVHPTCRMWCANVTVHRPIKQPRTLTPTYPVLRTFRRRLPYLPTLLALWALVLDCTAQGPYRCRQYAKCLCTRLSVLSCSKTNRKRKEAAFVYLI